MFSQLTNQTSFKSMNDKLTNYYLGTMWAFRTAVRHLHTQTSLLFLLLTQGPISSPLLSAKACVRRPTGSLRGCKRPRGCRRMITFFLFLSLVTHPCISTHTRNQLGDTSPPPALSSPLVYLFFSAQASWSARIKKDRPSNGWSRILWNVKTSN